MRWAVLALIFCGAATAHCGPLSAGEHRSRAVMRNSARASLPLHGAYERQLSRLWLRNRLTALTGVELVVMTPDDPGHCVMRPAPHRGATSLEYYRRRAPT